MQSTKGSLVFRETQPQEPIGFRVRNRSQLVERKPPLGPQRRISGSLAYGRIVSDKCLLPSTRARELSPPCQVGIGVQTATQIAFERW